MILVCQLETPHGESSLCHIWWPLGWRKYLIYHVTSQNHVIKGSTNFMSWTSLWYVTDFSSLIGIGFVEIDVCSSLSRDYAIPLD